MKTTVTQGQVFTSVVEHMCRDEQRTLKGAGSHPLLPCQWCTPDTRPVALHFLITRCVTQQQEVLFQYLVPPPELQHQPCGTSSSRLRLDDRAQHKLLKSSKMHRWLGASPAAWAAPMPAVQTPFAFWRLRIKHRHVANSQVLAHWSYLSGLPRNTVQFLRNKNCFLKHKKDIQWPAASWSRTFSFQRCR